MGQSEANEGGVARRATIKDVAALAGVSWKTVTNVLRGYPPTRESTRLRVLAATEQLGYRTNRAGRQLRTGKTGIIAVALPDVSVAYFAQLAQLFITEADKHDYHVLFYETLQDPARERIAASGLDGDFADGVIISPVALDAVGVAQSGRSIPIVVLGESADGSRADHVAIDNHRAAVQATQHLLSLGCRAIHFFGAEPGERTGTGGQRLSGVLEALATAGIHTADEPTWRSQPYSYEGGAQGVAELLASGREFDGLVCGNDGVALGAIHALRLAGLRVPQDVAVMGWDDTMAGRYANPTLSTVRPDSVQLVRLAFNKLLARIDGDSSPYEEIVIPHELVIRESTSGHPHPGKPDDGA